MAYSTKPSKGLGSGIRCGASSDQASEIMPGCEPCGVCAQSSWQRASSQSFSAASEAKLGVGCQSRWRASWTFFSICPFSSRTPNCRTPPQTEVADHGCEPCVDLAVLATPDFVDRRAHVVIDASPGNAAQHAEGVVMGVEQHLMGLLRIGAENEGAAVGELDVSDLQFGPLAADDRPIFRPVELERLARQKRKRHEYAAAARLLFLLPRDCRSRRSRGRPDRRAIAWSSASAYAPSRSPAAAYATACRRRGPACSAGLGRGASARRCPSAGICGPCSSTAPYAARSPGSSNGPDSAAVVWRSITPCRSLPMPPVKAKGARFEHGSVLGGNRHPELFLRKL